ncbi:MAG: mechanosensitive ion channel [Candidatus Omnitrophica bacterium]|nr:mechanosensitive ion channel [Candidatus Omnitrophota bacterium]
METFLNSLQESLGQSLPGVAGALALLVVGWIVALIIRGVLRKTLNLVKINERINTNSKGLPSDVASSIARGVYYVILMVVLLAVFNQLKLDVAGEPIRQLVNKLFAFIPNLIGGFVLVVVAWLIATISRKVLSGSIGVTSLDKKIKTGAKPLSQTLGDIVYWFVLLIFLPAILGVFQIEGLLAPMQSMIDKITGILPNIVAAALIMVAGWFVAKVLRELVTNLLSATGLNWVGEKAGFRGNMTLSGVVGLVVYFFVLIPAIIAGLNALRMNAIADPATQMLGAMMAAIPNIVAAVAIVVIVYLVANPVTGLISQMLGGAGFDRVPSKLGFVKPVAYRTTPSQWAGRILFFFMMLFASVEAANRLGFDKVSGVIAVLIQFGAQILMGSVIIAVGLWLANLVHAAMDQAEEGQHAMSGLVRVVIMGLVLAMGLRAMGLANDIVNMAFGLTLGAAAVAVALSFGLGGRDAAGNAMDHWLKSLRNPSSKGVKKEY